MPDRTTTAALVREGGLEPPRGDPPDPKSGASANSATLARVAVNKTSPSDGAPAVPTARPVRKPIRLFHGSAASSGPAERGGEPCRDRTYDPLIKSQLLYQLS
jgi:hypothetical protein